jgi:signal transduction histidine kinase/ActR/RegA family two-component response regulator
MAELALRSNVEAFPFGVIITDLTGRVIACNRQARDLFELDASPVGRPVGELDVPDGAPNFALEIERLRGSPASRRLPDAHLRRRTGDPAVVVTTVSPALDSSAEIAGAIIALEDFTRQRELEAVQRTDHYKYDFLAMLAHELRNPLSPIVSALGVIRRADGDETVQRAREVVERQVQHEVRLLDDLLDVARITNGKIELRCARVNAAAAMEHALDTVEPLIAARQHTVARMLPAMPLYVNADAVRLEQILGNILNNAALYTPPGGHIKVSIGADGDGVAFTVLDTGRGIPPERLPYVFDMFTQFHASIDRAVGGLGIGLALVKSLVELHDGTVTATSEGLGHGSEFTVRLPRLVDTPAQAPALAGGYPADAAGAAMVRDILIVEDNMDARDMLRAVLEIDGHKVNVAEDGLAGVEIGIANRPEIALIDIGLPGIDGYEVARRLRQHLGDRVLLVALTGYGQPEDRRDARAAGFDAHLTKPVDPAALTEVLAFTRRPAT